MSSEGADCPPQSPYLVTDATDAKYSLDYVLATHDSNQQHSCSNANDKCDQFVSAQRQSSSVDKHMSIQTAPF